MQTNKKKLRTNKKYSPKEVRLPGSNIPLSSVDIFKKLLSNTELFAEAIFKTKLASCKQMRYLRDLLNWGIVSIKNREYLNQEEVKSATKIHDRAANAFNQVLSRKLSSENDFRFSSEEISVISDALDIYIDYLKEQLRLSPRQTIVEFMVSFNEVNEIKQGGMPGVKYVLLTEEVNITEFRQKTKQFFGRNSK